MWVLIIVFYLAWLMYRTGMNALKKRLFSLEREVWMLQNFICETPILRDSMEKFGERKFVPHRSLISRSCACHNLDSRTEILKDHDTFWGKYFDDLVKSHEIKDDYDDDYEYRNTEEQFALKQKYLPLFIRLSELIPKKMTKSHVKWLTRHEMDLNNFRNFCLWFLIEEKPLKEVLPEDIKKDLQALYAELQIRDEAD